jgi:hypothetical protein
MAQEYAGSPAPVALPQHFEDHRSGASRQPIGDVAVD